MLSVSVRVSWGTQNDCFTWIGRVCRMSWVHGRQQHFVRDRVRSHARKKRAHWDGANIKGREMESCSLWFQDFRSLGAAHKKWEIMSFITRPNPGSLLPNKWTSSTSLSVVQAEVLLWIKFVVSYGFYTFFISKLLKKDNYIPSTEDFSKSSGRHDSTF